MAGSTRMSRDQSSKGPSPSSETPATRPTQTSTGARLVGGRGRALALEAAAEARAEWAYTSDILTRLFRTNRQLGSHDRRLVAETVYGLVRQERRIEAILDEVFARARRRREDLSPMARDEAKLLVYEAREAPDEGVRAQAVAELGKLLRHEVPADAVIGDDAGLGKRTGLEREAVRLSYPTWLLERFVLDLGEREGLAVAEAMNRRAPLTVHANAVKLPGSDARATLIERLSQEGVASHATTLARFGLVFDTRVNAFGLPSFQDGLFEVMDEGSQLVAESVAPPPQGRVVDACAGAGGKTLALAALMAGKGRLLAMDVSGKKLEELRRRARRAGLSNVAARAVEEGAPLPPEANDAGWDRVLVDAPCSGLGTLRRNPEARWRLTPAEVDKFPSRQLALLVTYAPLVAKGGRLIYATCTVNRDENDKVVARFLEERKDFAPVPLKEVLSRERAEAIGDGMTLRLYPHRQDTDGFFAAVLRRVG